MDTFTITVILSFIGFLVVGIWVSRGINNKNDYFVAGRNVGVLFIVGTLVASFLSTVALMGEAGMAYDGFPWPILLLGVMSKMGYLAGVVLFGRYLRDSDALTIPKFFGKRFNSSRLRALAGASVLVGMGLYLVTVTRGLAVVIEAILGIDGFWAVFITWVAFTIFTVLSGSKGVIITDTMMFFFFIIGGVLGSVAIFREAGGVKETFNKLAADPTLREGLLWHGQVEGPGERLNSIGEALIYIFTFGLVWAFVTAVSPWQASRYMMAKSSHTAIRAGIVTLLIIPSFYLFVMFAAYAVNLINPDIEPNSQVFIWAAYNIMPTAIGVILVTGIVAAGLSSASTFLSLVGFSAAHDVGPMFRRGEGLDGGDTKTDNVRSARWAMLIVGAIALLLAYIATPSVLDIGYMAASFFAASWGIVAFASTQSKRISETGAFWGMLLGGVITLILESIKTFGGVDWPMAFHPVLFGLAASLIAVIVGSMLRPVEKNSRQYISELKQRVESDVTVAEVKVTNRYIYVAIGFIAILFSAVGFFYVPIMS